MYTMKQTCQQVGMTYEALKFYCNEGLVPNVKRDENNHRLFDHRDIAWIKSLTCLKSCGMSIETMKTYLKLSMQGEATITQRQAILAMHKDALLLKIKELNDSVAYIDWKQQFYDDVLSGRINYESNITP